MRSASGWRWALALAALACSESTVPSGPSPHLTVVTGEGQSGPATDTLPAPLAIRVTDDEGRAVSGVGVSFSSSDPGSQFLPATTTTDANGLARTTWVLGVRSGTQTARMRATGWDDELAVTAEAVAGLKAVALMQGATSSHMCAIDAEGQAWCWGENFAGQLGDGTAEGSGQTPVRVAGGHRFRSLRGTWATTCGVTTGNEAWCWGSNQSVNGSGIFGDGSRTASLIPARAGGGLALRELDVSHRGTACGITLSDAAYCWGAGILGDGSPSGTSDVPIPVAGGHAWREISIGVGATCGVTLQGATLCWGEDGPSLLGIEGSGPYLVPTAVSIVPELSSVSLGWFWQCGMLSAGSSAVCWGSNPIDGDAAVPAPYAPIPGNALQRLVTEGESGAAVDQAGAVWAWGSIASCFDGPYGGPRLLQPEMVWADIAVGSSEIYAILSSDNTVHAWNDFGCHEAVAPANIIGLPSAIPAPAP